MGEKEIRIINIELDSCSSKCPYFIDEEYINICRHIGKIVFSSFKPFPNFCPLKKKDDEKFFLSTEHFTPKEEVEENPPSFIYCSICNGIVEKFIMETLRVQRVEDPEVGDYTKTTLTLYRCKKCGHIEGEKE